MITIAATECASLPSAETPYPRPAYAWYVGGAHVPSLSSGKMLWHQLEQSIMRTLIIAATAAVGLFSYPGFTQQPSQGKALIPDFSGIWTHPYFGVDPPISGAGPLRGRPGNRGRVVGDYTNPILKLNAAEAVKKLGEVELSGVPHPNPRNQCWPEGLPFIFVNPPIEMIQEPTKVTILYDHDNEVRHVRLNQPHSAPVIPSWYGDSVGHYEGDTLVIDTVGFKMGPFSMSDVFGTPFTEALHIVERYRLIGYEAAIEAQARGLKTHAFLAVDGSEGGLIVAPNYKGKGLQLEYTVEDEGVFTMPYSATVTYLRGIDRHGSQEWPELVCAENNHDYFSGKDAEMPRADKPDF
jgi:hypothetical protein